MTYKGLRTRAKINLTLDVLKKRVDGYHEVEMIMQTIDLYDEMEFKLTPGEISIHCNHPQVPSNEENIAFTVAHLLKKEYGVDWGVAITIHKNIPVAAGLAGGSTNGAGTLKALNGLWELGLTQAELMSIGSRVGADIPFCLLGGTVLAGGMGEVLQPLEPLPTTWMVLVKPQLSVSTPWVYSNLDLNNLTHRPDTEKVVEAIALQRVGQALPYLHNVLEGVTIKAYPQIQGIKEELEERGALKALMSGSGPSVFGLCENKRIAEEIYRSMREKYRETFLVKTYNGEVEI